MDIYLGRAVGSLFLPRQQDSWKHSCIIIYSQVRYCKWALRDCTRVAQQVLVHV